jgi:hypothetical protein
VTHYGNTEAIFSTIGDYPVVDQFDVLYSGLLEGTTYDNYITGSLLTAFSLSGEKPVYLRGERGLVFSKSSVSQTAVPNPNATGAKYANDGNQSYNLQPWRERAGTIRNVRHFSSTERFYDSMLPGLSQMLSSLNSYGIIYEPTYKYSRLFLGNGGSVYVTTGFLEAFPFEPHFSQVKRTKRLASTLITKYSVADVFPPPYADGPIDPLMVRKLYVSFTGNGSLFAGSALGAGLGEVDICKLCFGFGDKSNGTDSRYVPISRDDATYRVGPIIRGWKYGLVDGNPHYSSIVFRRDRFGQFRDMLEQRLNAACVDDEENAPLRYLGSFESPALPLPTFHAASLTNEQRQMAKHTSLLPNIESLNATPPVKVNFTRQSYIESTQELLYFSEKPENTWSSNLSLYATSSLPYFDGVARNRNEITSTPNTLILSALSDVFGNQILGG